MGAETVNSGFKWRKIAGMQEETSKALQCVRKSLFARNFSTTWDYEQHIWASSQKIMLILHSRIQGGGGGGG